MKQTINLPLLFVIGLFTALCSLCFAQQDQEQQSELSAIDKKLKTPITIDVVETPIEDVLMMIAQSADIDLVKSPKVTGTVSATLNNVPVEEVLDNILAVHNFGYVKTSNMIRVVPIADIVNVNEKIMSKVYRLTYADATNVSQALTKFLSPRGNISVNPGTSNIVITDIESKIKAIDEFIEEVDRVTEQVVVEVRIYDVTDNNALNLDIQWNAGRVTENTAGQSAAQTTGGGISYTDELVPGKAPDGTPIQGSSSGADPYAAASFDKTRGGAVRIGLFNDSVSLDLTLAALRSQGYAKLLANPSIMVIDKETANFEIVKEIPYKEESQSSQGGSLTSTKFKPVGIKLEVTPHITRDDMLRMRIAPEFGIAEEQIRNPVTQEPIVPTVHTRRLDTMALLRSGQTVVLGGLKQYETTKNYWKTPILGDLPLLGAIFRSESETAKASELLIFIRPYIIKDVPKMKIDEQKIMSMTQTPVPQYPGSPYLSDESIVDRGDEELTLQEIYDLQTNPQQSQEVQEDTQEPAVESEKAEMEVSDAAD